MGVANMEAHFSRRGSIGTTVSLGANGSAVSVAPACPLDPMGRRWLAVSRTVVFLTVALRGQFA